MTAAPCGGLLKCTFRQVLLSKSSLLCFKLINCLIELAAQSLMHHLLGG